MTAKKATKKAAPKKKATVTKKSPAEIYLATCNEFTAANKNFDSVDIDICDIMGKADAARDKAADVAQDVWLAVDRQTDKMFDAASNRLTQAVIARAKAFDALVAAHSK